MEKKTNNKNVNTQECKQDSSPQNNNKQDENVEILTEEQVFQKAIEDAKREADEYKNMLQRLQAEFDNYRKRTGESARTSRQDGICDVIMELIPAIDNLERGISVIEDTSARNGMEIILKQLLEVLSKFDITEITALGQLFNPDIHHAVAKDDDCDGSGESIVSEVFEKGYKRHQKILRPSMVKVSNKN